MAKTTKKDFELFKSETNYWIDRFNLREWSFWIVHRDFEGLSNILAWANHNWAGRSATIGLSINWEDSDINDYNICRSGFHEVCELLLIDIRSIAEIDICETQKYELEKSIHSAIRRLEWAVWEPDYTARIKKK